MLTDLTASPLWLGLAASLAAGLATAIGGLPVLFTRRISPRVHDGMLGGAAGVMLAATVFSLIIPAMAYAGGGTTGALTAAAGLLLGALGIDLADKLFPHEHFLAGTEGGGDRSRLARIWLFIVAIAIHNFPEGLAVGVGFGSGDMAGGLTLAIGIALQNIPEGGAVAMALAGQGYSPGRILWITLLTGLVEPVGGLLGAGAVMLARPVLPYALAFAAGAMLFVIGDEIIPETHRRGNERAATWMLVVGFIIMMLLDTTLG